MTAQHHTQTCDRCGASWQIAWKCQIICPNCGARQDCSDLFVDHDAIAAAAKRRPKAQDGLIKG